MENQYVNKIVYATYVLNDELRIVDCDEEFTNITGYSARDIRERKIGQGDLLFETDHESYFTVARQTISESGELYMEHRLRKKDGTQGFVFCLGRRIQRGCKEYWIVRITDMAQMNAMRLAAEEIRREKDKEVATLFQQANTDELTGLLRRGAFFSRMEKYIAREKYFALLMIDIDEFKQINDRHGHSVGDEALRLLAGVLKEALRDEDLICRLGGDEFAVLLTDIQGQEKARRLIHRIFRHLEDARIEGNEMIRVHVSIGAKVWEGQIECCTVRELYLAADRALYTAKNQGRNSYVFSE